MKNKMFRICAIILCLSTFVEAQVPKKFNYQAVARDMSGSAIINQLISVRISISDAAVSGNVEYSEEHFVSTNQFGMFTLEIGNGTVLTGSMDSVGWIQGARFILTEMDPAGGSSYVDMGSTELLSVPYALWSGNTITEQDTLYSNINGQAGYLIKFTDSVSGSNSVLFEDNGAVGLGTTIPSAKFEINHNGASFNPHLKLLETDPFDFARLTFQNVSGNNYWAIEGLNSLDNANERLNFRNSLSGNIMSLTGNGLFGIGTGTNGHNPNSLMTVKSSKQISAHFENDSLSGTGGVGSQQFIDGTFATGLRTEYNGTAQNDGVALYAKAVNTDLFYGFGGVFIGNFSGVYGSGVLNGHSAVYGDENGAFYSAYFAGNVTVTGVLSNPSDRRLKKNIEQYSGALAKIRGLNTYSYDFIDKKGMNLAEGKQFGFMAEDMKINFPELVTDELFVSENKERFEYNGINYTGMIPVLTQAIKEQQEIIENLLKRIESLESRIAAEN
ncbi:MAG: tail fiber domain-containing protein [Bacteroidetes bacterium]|nr:MAG: tail fiber domain-containing protein [Bacteroidota bacterium]REK35182.1 MAG: tail fiber domain-containing protein [Bacteroidota bacterium]